MSGGPGPHGERRGVRTRVRTSYSPPPLPFPFFPLVRLSSTLSDRHKEQKARVVISFLFVLGTKGRMQPVVMAPKSRRLHWSPTRAVGGRMFW